jgi:diguanylate cyclase (GGDEF)-like protein
MTLLPGPIVLGSIVALALIGFLIGRCQRLRKAVRLQEALIRELDGKVQYLTLQQVAQDGSTRDRVSGLFNQSYMKASLTREIHRAARLRVPISVIMIELPHLGALADSVGEEAANLVIREVGRLLQKNIRGGDLACRYDQNQFVLILAGMSHADALARAEYLSQEIEGLELTHAGEPLGVIRATAAAAVHTDYQSGASGDRVLLAATMALYDARTWGQKATV